MKTFNITQNVGKAKYCLSYNDGQKKHKDGSLFFDIEIFKNKKSLNVRVSELINNGYQKS